MVASCGTPAPPRSAHASTTRATSHPSGGPLDWGVLAASLRGSLVIPGDASYGTDALLYNSVFTPAPAAIAYCATAADVQRCLAFARQHEVPIAARSGGHSYGGYSTTSGLVIDLSVLKTVSLSGTGTAARATVGAGASLIEVYSQLGTAGYLLPGGSCPSVGIAGLALGGGIGVFGRAYGMTCDHIEAIDLVTADSTVRRCSATQHDDLHWASQGGGGGNFGIATSFAFRLHPIPDVTLFTLEWPWAAATDVMGAWLNWIGDTPDALWANCQCFPATVSAGVMKVTGVCADTVAACTSALAPLTSAIGAAPTYRFVGPEQYLRAMLIEAGCQNEPVAQCAAADTRYPFAAKSTYVNGPPSDAVISALVSSLGTFGADVPQAGGGLVFDGYGGAINAVDPAATAFVHRSAVACAQYSVTFPTASPSAAEASAARSWLDAVAQVLAPVAHGSYQNYIDPTLSDWAEAYYGANLPRLRSIKRKWDPDGVFHFAQSIPA